ncbi:MAG: tRNA (adenosine(37)-N6)-threonylcarbamoyltransferase complex ATPase subunit type 1 TsaE [Candidatus Cloacimonetes bacterium]|nr:tRNA (adenosine(37)-N6)-threonylcarbamoyltransferase complex ATPase subunit type 1 TsaE [Candidatus Cloacimonadota bacterium]
MLRLSLPRPIDTQRFAHCLATTLRGNETIALSGPLGAGKTCLVRHLCLALGVTDNVSSPSYALLHEYSAPDFPVHHFDLYRLQSEEEVWELGLREVFGQGLVLIEWPELARDMLPTGSFHLHLDYHDSGRELRLNGPVDWLARLEAAWRELP